MARFLIITWDGGGNVPPAIGIAQELKERGHAVTFAGYESQQHRIMERGFPFTPINHQSGNWMDLPPEQRLFGRSSQVWACQEHLQDVPKLVANEQPDAVLVDCMMYAALAAVENLNLAHAVLLHSPPGFNEPGCKFDQFMLSAINAIRAKARRPAISSSWEAWSNAPAICVTLPELDPLAGQVPPSFQYVGPVFERMPGSGWCSPWSSDDPRALVLVSFSTHAAWDQTSRISRSVKALANHHFRVLVTSSMARMDETGLPENVVVRPYLPHAEVLPEVKVVITHAGHGTVTSSLAHGVPMICLPNIQSDQPGLAARVESLGAGLVLDGDNATSEEIRQAVARVIDNPSYTAAAQRLSEKIEAARCAERAASLLEQLV